MSMLNKLELLVCRTMLCLVAHLLLSIAFSPPACPSLAAAIEASALALLRVLSRGVPAGGDASWSGSRIALLQGWARSKTDYMWPIR